MRGGQDPVRLHGQHLPFPHRRGRVPPAGREAGLGNRITADSAGTHGYHVGEPPDPRSRQAAKARGVDLSGLRARKLAAVDFSTFDHILALDHGHLAHLRRMAPAGSTAALALFLPDGREVPDPYYGDGTHFEEVLDLCERGARALLDRIRRETRNSRTESNR